MSQSQQNMAEPDKSVVASGKYLFRDDFDEDIDHILERWDVIQGGPPTVSGSILTLPNVNCEIRSKRKFLYGFLILAVKSTVNSTFYIGFSDGGNNYLILSASALRYKSTVDNTEGNGTVTYTETNYNIIGILWEPDMVAVWVNGGTPVTYQGIKIPNTPCSIELMCLNTGGDTTIDFVAVYPEPVETLVMGGGGALGTTYSAPVTVQGGIPSGTSRIGTVCIDEKLLAAPYTDTTTALGAGAAFTGTARDLQITTTSPFEHLGEIRAYATADQSGTLYIDESPDNTTWINGVKSVALAANEVKGIEHKPAYRYVRVRYVNGATAQGSFRLWSRVAGKG